MSEFVRLSLPLFPVGRGRFFDRNIWPDFRVFCIQRQPFLKPWSGISLNGIDGTFWFANATVDAFVRMDDEHILALVEAIHGAHSDAVHGFAANAALVDDIGQLSILSADRSNELIRDVRPLGGRFSAENGRKGDQCRLARSVHRTADIQESIGAYPSSWRSFRHRDTHSLGIHQSADANFRERQEGSATEFATLYRIEFWKMDLGAFTGRGQGGPCLTDAAQ